MSALPFRFGSNSWSYLEKTSLSYSFDNITGITIDENSALPFSQVNKIPAIGIELEGRTANPNIALSLNGVTNLYNIQQLYICSHRQVIEDNVQNTKLYSLVIEGYSTADVQKQKVFIFIPIDSTGSSISSTNSFDGFNTIFTYLNNNSGNVTSNSNGTKTISELKLDINALIPDENYYIYSKTDDNTVSFTVIFFDNSNLTSSANTKAYLTTAFSNNDAEIIYDGLDGTGTPGSGTAFEVAVRSFLLYKSKVKPTKKASISTSFEDNIYIDCQPVDIPNKKTSYYFQKLGGYGQFMQIGFVYLFSIMFISILVYSIYNIKSLFKTSADNEIYRINQSLQEFSKYVK